MMRYVYSRWLIVLVLNFIIANQVDAQNMDQSSESVQNIGSSDFSIRLNTSANLWQYILTFIKTVNNELEKQIKVAKSEISINDLLDNAKEHQLPVVTLAKYFYHDELQVLSSFINSPEMSSLTKKIIGKIFSTNEQVRLDRKLFIREIRMIANLVRQKLNPGTDLVSNISNGLDLSEWNTVPPAKADKGEVAKRLSAANEVLEMTLPLLDQGIRRELIHRWPDLKRSQISMAIKVMTLSLQENPILVLILAKNFDSNELKRVASFLQTLEVQAIVDRLSRSITARDEQTFRDFLRVVNELQPVPLRIMEMMAKPVSEWLSGGTSPTSGQQTAADATEEQSNSKQSGDSGATIVVTPVAPSATVNPAKKTEKLSK